jgi:YaiO family outer membrane protein
MFVALLLTAALAGPPDGAQTPQGPTATQAQEPVRQGNQDAALNEFRRRAAANPSDLAARIAIARLHERKGRPDLAEPVYRSVLLEAPNNIDALRGVGTSLIRLQRADEAIVMLTRAARLEPKNAGIAAALGAAHLEESHLKLGISYLDLAASVAPTPENRRAFEQARRTYGHHVAASGLFEQFNGDASDTGSGNLTVDYRLRDRLRVMARGQYQHKFDISDQRGGAGFEWRLHPQIALSVHALAGPDNEVLPRADTLIQIGHTARHGGWDLGYRFVDFQGAHVSVVTPGVRWSDEPFSIGFRYSLALTNFDALADAEDGHTAALDSAHRLTPRLWLNLGYVYGVDDFDTLSPDRLGRFKAHTVRGGFRAELATLTSVLALYEHQWRPDDVEMNRVSLTLTQAF